MAAFIHLTGATGNRVSVVFDAIEAITESQSWTDGAGVVVTKGSSLYLRNGSRLWVAEKPEEIEALIDTLLDTCAQDFQDEFEDRHDNNNEPSLWPTA